MTRFSGRSAPEHSGRVPNLPDAVAKKAYNQEVSNAGFWPGAGLGYPAFYAYPTPEGFKDASVEPEDAFFSEEMGEFVLPYGVVQQAADPNAKPLRFLHSKAAALFHSTYDAAATLAR